MKDNSSLSNSIGWGCTAALTVSALALAGSCTLLGMSWLIKDNHAPKGVEDTARRVAQTAFLSKRVISCGWNNSRSNFRVRAIR